MQRVEFGHLRRPVRQVFATDTVHYYPGLDLARGRAGARLKLVLAKTMINNARQLRRSLVGIYH